MWLFIGVDSSSDRQEIPKLLWSRKFHDHVRQTPSADSVLRGRKVEFTPSRPISVNTIFILSYNARKIRCSYSEPLGIPTKIYTLFSLPPTSYNVHSAVLVLMIPIQIIIHIILSVRSTYSAEYSFSLYSSRRVRPNFALIKTTGKVIIMCNQIFNLRDMRPENQDSKLRDFVDRIKHTPILPLIFS